MCIKPSGKSSRWFKACVEQQVDVRSYEVRTEDGRTEGLQKKQKAPQAKLRALPPSSIPDHA